MVDDAQWLDRASAHVLAFVARHVGAAPVALVFAVRQPGGEQDLTGLPELLVGGLADGDARALLDSVVIGPLDKRVRDRIVAETRGNPQALLEWPRRLIPGELAGGFGLPGAVTPTSRIEEGFLARFESLPESTRLLLVAAAADPTGDPVLLWRGGRPARRQGRSRGAGDRRRADRVPRAGAVLPSACPGRGLLGGVAAATSARPPRPCGRHRPGRRSRSPCLASRARRTRTG